jgi:hypothetical protein
MLHVHAASPCCMSILHANAACPGFKSILHVCFSLLHVYAACHAAVHVAYLHCISTLHEYIRSVNINMNKNIKMKKNLKVKCCNMSTVWFSSMQHVHCACPSAYQCCISMLHFYALCLCLHAAFHVVFPCFMSVSSHCMSTLHVNCAWTCSLNMNITMNMNIKMKEKKEHKKKMLHDHTAFPFASHSACQYCVSMPNVCAPYPCLHAAFPA